MLSIAWAASLFGSSVIEVDECFNFALGLGVGAVNFRGCHLVARAWLRLKNHIGLVELLNTR